MFNVHTCLHSNLSPKQANITPMERRIIIFYERTHEISVSCYLNGNGNGLETHRPEIILAPTGSVRHNY